MVGQRIVELPRAVSEATPETATEEWLTSGEAAAVLGVRSGTVSKRIGGGRLSAERHGKGWVLSRREVSALLKVALNLAR